jgi:hypothetical protein
MVAPHVIVGLCLTSEGARWGPLRVALQSRAQCACNGLPRQRASPEWAETLFLGLGRVGFLPAR